MAVGNVLMGDDGLGPHVLKLLEARYELDVAIFDAGTPGLDLTLFLDGFDAIVAIDALKAKGAAGEVRTYRKEQLVEGGLPVVMSPHEPTLREALMRLKLLGRGPSEVFLVGAIPEKVETGPGLTAAVQRAIPEIEQQVVRELRRLGAKVAPRAKPLQPDIWWEAVAR